MVLDDDLHFLYREKPVVVQTFMPKLAVEAHRIFILSFQLVASP